MFEPTPAEIAVRDPLSEVTRNERGFLLGASVIAIVLVRTGLVPSKISALGIEFSPTDQKALLSVLALVIIYFVVAFAIYAASDFIAWRLALQSAMRAWIHRDRGTSSHREMEERLRERFRIIPYFLAPTSLLRGVFEFLLPLIVGIYAAQLLFHAPPPLEQEHRSAPVVILPAPITIDSETPVHLFP
jgi:hypothetical protein